MQKPVLVKIGVFLIIAALFIIAYVNFSEYLSLEYIKEQQEAFKKYYQGNKAAVLGGYFVLYVFVTALSLPGAAVMTVLAGALFGLVIGVILVSFASSIGATLAFLVARFLVGKSLQEKYGDKLKTINDGVEREGAFYLFTMRLIPAFPFFLINLLMALTTLPVVTFYWVSQAGMFAGTIVYVYAGTALSEIESIGDILSWELGAAFVAIGVLPLVSKKVVALIRSRRASSSN